jgi:hypothetical protein
VVLLALEKRLRCIFKFIVILLLCFTLIVVYVMAGSEVYFRRAQKRVEIL